MTPRLISGSYIHMHIHIKNYLVNVKYRASPNLSQRPLLMDCGSTEKRVVLFLPP